MKLTFGTAATVVAFLVVGACGGTTDPGTSGPNGQSTSSGAASGTTTPPPAPIPPQAMVTSKLAPGANPTAGCPESGAFLTIGSPGEPPVKSWDSIANGESFLGGRVAVSCRVAPAGATAVDDIFTVEASAELEGPGGGSIAIRGTYRGRDYTKNTMSVTISKDGRAYSELACAVSETSISMGATPGHFGAEINCYEADAPAIGRKCWATIVARFDGCLSK